jgi:tRNA pseudouridine38-40 synthase
MIKLVIEYDGAPFVGWQVQLSGPSVQEAVETAMARLCNVPREQLKVTAAGRTDSGVHARGQVVSIDPPGAGAGLPMRAFTAGMNGLLPASVSVVSAEWAPDGFDARRWATGKRYIYSLRNAPIRSPLWRTRAWEVRRPFDIAAMREAANHLLGRHDFSALRAGDCPANNPVRELKKISLEPDGRDPAVFHLLVEGTAFLKHMIRTIAGTLAEVGHGKRAASSIPALLEGRDRSKAGVTAPPHGLVLDEVFYLSPLSDPRPARLNSNPHPEDDVE